MASSAIVGVGCSCFLLLLLVFFFMVSLYLSGLLASDFPDNPGNVPGKAVVPHERGKVQNHSAGAGLYEGKLAGAGYWRGLHCDRVQRMKKTA